MATLKLAARRYAQAAFELAMQDGSTDAWSAALDAIAAFMSEADVKSALENTRFAQESKLQLVNAGLNDLPRLPLNLARLLARKGRTNLAGDIATAFKELVEGSKGIAHAHARTAVALNAAQRDAMAQSLGESTGKEVILETEVDPAVLGGVIIQIGDRLIDASTRARLAALRESLVGAV